MADWSNPEPFQLLALHEALRFAYPTPGEMNAFMLLYLGKSYNALAPVGESYDNGLPVVLARAVSEGWLQDWVQRARKHRPKSPKLMVLDRDLELTNVEIPPAIGRSLEDIVRNDGLFKDLMPWVEKLAQLGHQTCRIEYPVNTAAGTGWLVGPDLVMTNWHVIDAALPGGERKASEYVCRFDYAVTAAGAAQPGIETRLAADWLVSSSPPSTSELGTGNGPPTADHLDYALLRLATPIGAEARADGVKRGWVDLGAARLVAKPAAGEILFAIQHPDGLPVKVAPGDVLELTADSLRMAHSCNTKGGSSGSVVVNASLDVVALHHAGDPLYHRGEIGAPKRNHAVPIHWITTQLLAQGHLH